MNIADHPSEIARFRAELALAEQAMQHMTNGLAVTARHDIITARAQRGAERILGLVEEGKLEEAFALMNHPTWGEPFPKEPGLPSEQNEPAEAREKLL